MRVFIAVEFDQQMKEYFEEKQKRLQESSSKGNFTRKENFHLTIRFIGEASGEKIQSLKRAMKGAAHESEPFWMELGHLGSFPRGAKNILWIGIGRGLEPLTDLFNRLEMHLQEEGFEKEPRGLKPHITLGREIRLDKDMKFLQREIRIDPLRIQADSISLMESKRVDGILKYEPIAVFPLG